MSIGPAQFLGPVAPGAGHRRWSRAAPQRRGRRSAGTPGRDAPGTAAAPDRQWLLTATPQRRAQAGSSRSACLAATTSRFRSGIHCTVWSSASSGAASCSVDARTASTGASRSAAAAETDEGAGADIRGRRAIRGQHRPAIATVTRLRRPCRRRDTQPVRLPALRRAHPRLSGTSRRTSATPPDRPAATTRRRTCPPPAPEVPGARSTHAGRRTCRSTSAPVQVESTRMRRSVYSGAARSSFSSDSWNAVR